MTRPSFATAPEGRLSGMDETDILSRIHSLVDEEHKLREAGRHTDEQRARMGKLEADLDQCWDLLRQREAHEEFRLDPENTSVRDESTVEGYEQ